MPAIQQLAASVVNKIAAGEVIERPASVVKELMENALDAGARRIDVSIEQGGLELIRVVDDGGGIPPDQLELAIASHATSKLETADDLFRVRTLGFRGEALASIASVSRLLLRSHAAGHAAAAELEVVAGQSSPVSPCGAPQGAAVEVRNLFFNTPVRRKFLRSVQTEMGHVGELFTRLALAHPSVHFTLRHNNRSVYDAPPCADWQERIGAFFGRDLAEALLWIENRDDRVRLSGYVGHPSQNRPNPRMQYLFLNGRSIRDRSLQHALGEAYRGLILTGRYPVSFLCIEMPPDMVDVNVHPTKMEVRFQDSGRLYSQLLGTLRTRFLTADLNHRLEPAPPPDGPAAAHDPQRAEQMRRELVDWAKGQVSQWTSGGEAALGASAGLSQDGGLSVAPSPGQAWSGVSRQASLDMAAGPLTLNALPGRAPIAAAPRDPVARWDAAGAVPVVALQVHNRYLVAESEEGVVVIDQHALHERILYEQLRERVLAGAVESQRLLTPEPVDLSGPESAAVLEARPLLAQLGVQVEPFGGDTLLVSSYPAILAGSSPTEVLRELVEVLVDRGRPPERRDLLDELLHMVACKAAIKAGDRLAPEEISALLEQRHLAQDTHHCPHGRPTALIFTREELDKQFKRI